MVKTRLLNRWNSLWRRTASAGDPGPIFGFLLQCYQEPGRVHSTLEHLQHCLSELDARAALGPPFGDRDAVELALWFHDAVCDPARTDNEERSAALLQGIAAYGGHSPALVAKTVRMIRLNAGFTAGGDAEAAVMIGCDISILGSDPGIYRMYIQDIRGEYAFLSDQDWRLGRARALRGCLGLAVLYEDAWFRT